MKRKWELAAKRVTDKPVECKLQKLARTREHHARCGDHSRGVNARRIRDLREAPIAAEKWSRLNICNAECSAIETEIEAYRIDRASFRGIIDHNGNHDASPRRDVERPVDVGVKLL